MRWMVDLLIEHLSVFCVMESECTIELGRTGSLSRDCGSWVKLVLIVSGDSWFLSLHGPV